MVCAHEETEDLLGCTVSSTRRGAGAGLSENNFLVWGKKKKLCYTAWQVNIFQNGNCNISSPQSTCQKMVLLFYKPEAVLEASVLRCPPRAAHGQNTEQHPRKFQVQTPRKFPPAERHLRGVPHRKRGHFPTPLQVSQTLPSKVNFPLGVVVCFFFNSGFFGAHQNSSPRAVSLLLFPEDNQNQLILAKEC